MKSNESKYKYINKKDGKTYDLIVRRKNKKNLSFAFRDGIIYANVPFFTSNDYINKCVDELIDSLIKNKRGRSKYYNEEGIYIFGEFVKFDCNFVKVFGHNILFTDIDDFYKKISKYVVPYFVSLTRKYEEIMGINEPYKVTVKDMDTLYGCNHGRSHMISYNIQLIHFSEEILTTVVVHELAHHFAMNHQKEFYDVVYKYSPNYDELDGKLRRYIFK